MSEQTLFDTQAIRWTSTDDNEASVFRYATDYLIAHPGAFVFAVNIQHDEYGTHLMLVLQKRR